MVHRYFNQTCDFPFTDYTYQFSTLQDGSGEGKIVSLDISGSWPGNFKVLSQLQPFTKNVTDIKLVHPQQDAQHNPVSSKGKAQVKEKLDCYTTLKDLTVDKCQGQFSLFSFYPTTEQPPHYNTQ